MGIRTKLRRNRTQKKGMPPGSLVYIGDEQTEEVTISAIAFDSDKIDEYKNASLDEVKTMIDSEKVTWVNV
ncbi:hypothetical protein R0K20_19795, partial [Staphylococcus sp. SIMBA_130]